MMTNEHERSSPEAVQKRARQAATLKVIIVFLVVSAVIVGGFLTFLPVPVRVLVASTDLIAAAVLALVVRQKFSR
jgi:archaellum biogenesis protein FlaJ (TadC family)